MMWVLVSSVGKMFFRRIRDLGFKLRLHQKPIGVLGLVIKSDHVNIIGWNSIVSIKTKKLHFSLMQGNKLLEGDLCLGNKRRIKQRIGPKNQYLGFAWNKQPWCKLCSFYSWFRRSYCLFGSDSKMLGILRKSFMLAWVSL